ncbi:hypothetical protein ABZ297_28890 [Nonomuraea sp. NPDC005983]|uniref:hypothetical protein n=1 Tax=Nonomuraea sp. NPDC005983 TaxID=3155595 RepID=UPI0033A92B8B
MRELIASFSCLDSGRLVERLVRSAAAVAGTSYAGLAQVDPLREEAHTQYLHGPPGDPLRVRRWLRQSGVLKELAGAPAPVLLPRDAEVGEPGFMATPVPLATRDHAFGSASSA